jgi:hypothetical protein
MVQQYSVLEISISGPTDLRSTNLATIKYEHGPFRKYPQENKRAAPILDALAAIANNETDSGHDERGMSGARDSNAAKGAKLRGRM